MSIQHFNPGEPLRAARLNELVDGINGATPTRPRTIIDSAVAETISALSPNDLIQCRIVTVNAPGAGANSELPSDVRYTVRGIGQTGIVLVGVYPKYGRPVRGNEARIWPARVDDICYIVRRPTSERKVVGELMLLPGSEVLAFRTCGGAGAVAAPAVFRLPPPLPIPELPPSRGERALTNSGAKAGGGAAIGASGGAGDLSGQDGGGSIT
jgi:hypothetical protein